MRLVTALLLVLLPIGAVAQEAPPRRTVVRTGSDWNWLTSEDRNAYCFWSGQLFSIGASFCIRQQTVATCTEVAGRRPIWVNKENDKFCDRNPSLTPD
jgi:hypothetical protein